MLGFGSEALVRVLRDTTETTCPKDERAGPWHLASFAHPIP
jgi:hypothetical protein